MSFQWLYALEVGMAFLSIEKRKRKKKDPLISKITSSSHQFECSKEIITIAAVLSLQLAPLNYDMWTLKHRTKLETCVTSPSAFSSSFVFHHSSNRQLRYATPYKKKRTQLYQSLPLQSSTATQVQLTCTVATTLRNSNQLLTSVELEFSCAYNKHLFSFFAFC
ncbi:uncharacterized protein LOC126673426 [Mercurialis annua]|uniref:uncharacterized protein LOC126673426 n=1 Tax=Mercurialis annua TaxID=3986 RepID=UPI0024AE815C|nr:uncharacterized protein LOC126673426 [Mercurialis annua]XP_055961207.1 uncharacterized protein LOC126673426 [Mercurialis annua]XP_055961208.1 uncharacterized protein LOC126673426 [Mercurialis annua]XP_055961209.1 uncharacterized protein LOC126673426 [Mercurialis annua]XP_055961210.1 uncharacterized protein LOC126673426 [Mercurialis annua]